MRSTATFPNLSVPSKRCPQNFWVPNHQVLGQRMCTWFWLQPSRQVAFATASEAIERYKPSLLQRITSSLQRGSERSKYSLISGGFFPDFVFCPSSTCVVAATIWIHLVFQLDLGVSIFMIHIKCVVWFSEITNSNKHVSISIFKSCAIKEVWDTGIKLLYFQHDITYVVFLRVVYFHTFSLRGKCAH